VLLFADGDPTGLSSPLGTITIIAALVATLVVLLRALWQRRGK
jgi:hypothetical protein